MWVAFVKAKATHIFFSKNISVYAIFNDQSFSDVLTNDIVSFEQQGPPGYVKIYYCLKAPYSSKIDILLSKKGLLNW